MPNWKKVVISGSSPDFNNVTLDGTLAIPGFTNVSASLAAKAEGTILYENGTGTNSIQPNINSNNAAGACSNIGGGISNTVTGPGSTIGGGHSNTNSGEYSFIGGGRGNSVSNDYSGVVSGNYNTISSCYSFIGSGYGNKVCSGDYNALVGGSGNSNSGSYAFIGAGSCNHITSNGLSSTISAGYCNTVSNSYSTISAGYCNIIDSDNSGVVSGYRNEIKNCSGTSQCSHIGGGAGNCIHNGNMSTIGGGASSEICNACQSHIGGGFGHSVKGHYNTVSGGYENVLGVASGNSGILGGCNNNVNHSSSFIIGSDLTSNAACTTFVNNLNVDGTLTVDGTTISSGVFEKIPASGSITEADIASFKPNFCTNTVETNHKSFQTHRGLNAVLYGCGNIVMGAKNLAWGTNNKIITSSLGDRNFGIYNQILGGNCNTVDIDDGSVGSSKHNNIIGGSDVYYKGCYNSTLSSDTVTGYGHCNTVTNSCNVRIGISSVNSGGNNILYGQNVSICGSIGTVIAGRDIVVGDCSQEYNTSQICNFFVANSNCVDVCLPSDTSGNNINARSGFNSIISSCKVSTCGSFFQNVIGSLCSDLCHTNTNSTRGFNTIISSYQSKVHEGTYSTIIGSCNSQITSSYMNNSDLNYHNTIIGGRQLLISSGDNSETNNLGNFNYLISGECNTIKNEEGFLSNNGIIGGQCNYINLGFYNNIFNSVDSEITASDVTSTSAQFNTILGSCKSNIYQKTNNCFLFHNIAVGGKQNDIIDAQYSSVVGGCNNTVCLTNCSQVSSMILNSNNSCVTGHASTMIGSQNATINSCNTHFIGMSSFSSNSCPNYTYVRNLCVYGTTGGNGTIAGVELVRATKGKFGSNTTEIGDDYTSTGAMELTGSIFTKSNITASGAISSSDNITGNSFVKGGGTSTQFLKADGSVDSNTYLTSVGTIDLASDVEGTLPEENGGTGATSLGDIALSSFDDDLSYIALTGNQSAAGTKTFTGQIVIGANGSISAPMIRFPGTSTNTGFYASNPDEISITRAGSQAFKFDANGLQVLLSGTSQFSGHLQAHCLGVGGAAPGTSGEIWAYGDVVANYSSDKRLKKNIKPISGALDKLLQISGVKFDWIEKKEVHSHKGHDVGVIAQEIEEVLPEVVATRDNGYKAVNYEKIVPLLIEAIKDLKAEVDELKKSK